MLTTLRRGDEAMLTTLRRGDEAMLTMAGGRGSVSGPSSTCDLRVDEAGRGYSVAQERVLRALTASIVTP